MQVLVDILSENISINRRHHIIAASNNYSHLAIQDPTIMITITIRMMPDIASLFSANQWSIQEHMTRLEQLQAPLQGT
jgi:hypothetical protein